MPITFGSVGDIISLCLLIKDITIAIHDCQGSPHSFQKLLTQLKSLEQALLQVDLLIRKHEASPQFNALAVAARHVANECRVSAEPFLQLIKSYQHYLRPEGSGNVMKDTLRKVQWKILSKDAVDSFYAEISAHVGALNMILHVWSM